MTSGWDPEKSSCGVRLNVTVSVVPEPEALLPLQFKVKTLLESVAACPGMQLPLTPNKELSRGVCNLTVSSKSLRVWRDLPRHYRLQR